jgi:hypothetical protein
MFQRRSAWLTVALLCGVLVAGCGSSSSTSGSTSNSTTATSTATAASTTTSTTTGSAGAAGIVDSTAVADCKKAIKDERELSSNAKGKLESVCEQAAKGNTVPLKKVEREICEEAVDKAGVPAVAKTEAAAACKSKA